ncbi:MAG: type 1 glutamine amidotransferase domain-containing protein [Bacteroidia bacterium]|nr:type 1 glutamine amidotransferase domain-containing protein [Bacteroidia bacterium]
MKNIITTVLFLIAINASLLQAQSKKLKVLFVLTSHNQLGNTGKPTGFWIEEFATPYYYFTDKNIEVTVASPKGGQAPIDPKSNEPNFQTQSTKRYFADPTAQSLLKSTKKLSDVNAQNFDAVFYPGGHGPMWDLANDKNSIELIKSFYNQNKAIAFVCHGSAALVNVKLKNGDYLIKDKKLTSFCNTEEEAVQLSSIVPFSLENKLKERGAIYQKGNDWTSFVVEEGLLITGQNPQSSEEVADKLLHKLSQTKK